MISGTNDRYLQKGVAIPLIYEKMEPNLIWDALVRQIPETTNAFLYQYDSSGASGDSKKKTPPKYNQGAKFPELDKSRRTTASGLTKSNGFSMRIPRDVIRSEAGKSEIMDAYETAGFWMAEWMNTNIFTALYAGATAASSSAAAVWSDASATPVADLINFDSDMDREGYPFRMTDVFVNKTNWYELKQYLTSVDIGDLKQKALYGVPSISKDVVSIPVVDAEIHKVMSGMTDGTFLAADRNNKSAELHFYNDPKFSMAQVRYKTVIDSTPTTVTAPNLGIHFKQYEEDDTHDTILQFWAENATVVTKPYGLLKGTDI